MVQLENLQRCMEYCSAAESMFCLQTCNVISAISIDKLLSYWLIEILHALHGILQCCRVTVLSLD